MRSLILLLLLSGIACSCLAGVQRTGLKAAIGAGLVTSVAVSSGGTYNAKALKLRLTNMTRDALQITVDPALIFRPDDTGYQTLVLPAEEMLTLAPGATGEIIVQTFCGKAHAAAPGAKLAYTFWKQGDSTMIRVTQYIRKHSLYDGLGQGAIWALTDRHNLDGVIDPARPKESAELLALMVKETGWATPTYFRMYKLNTVAGQPVFEKRILKIIATMEWKLDTPKALTLGIFDKTGGLVQGVFQEKRWRKAAIKCRWNSRPKARRPAIILCAWKPATSSFNRSE